MELDSLLNTLIGTTSKGMLVFLLAGAVILRLRRASAEIRHLVWLGALTGALLLPVVGWFLPSLNCLPSWMSFEPFESKEPAMPFPVAALQATEASDDKRVASALKKVAFPESTATTTLVKDDSAPALAASQIVPAGEMRQALPVVASTDDGAPNPQQPSNGAHASPDSSQQSSFTTASSAHWLLAIWGVGTSLLLAPVVVSMIRLRLIERRSKRLTSGRLFEVIDAVKRKIGLQSDVDVYLTAEPTMPRCLWFGEFLAGAFCSLKKRLDGLRNACVRCSSTNFPTCDAGIRLRSSLPIWLWLCTGSIRWRGWRSAPCETSRSKHATTQFSAMECGPATTRPTCLS